MWVEFLFLSWIGLDETRMRGGRLDTAKSQNHLFGGNRFRAPFTQMSSAFPMKTKNENENPENRKPSALRFSHFYYAQPLEVECVSC